MDLERGTNEIREAYSLLVEWYSFEKGRQNFLFLCAQSIVNFIAKTSELVRNIEQSNAKLNWWRP